MFKVWAYSLLSVSIVSALSLVGIFALFLRRELHEDVLRYLVSFSVGALFSSAFFHLIPEALEATGFTNQVSSYIIVGILVSFIVEQVLKWRHCHVPSSDEHPHSYGYMNLIGDAIHNTIDGIIIGGSYLVSPSLGILTTITVCLHELPQEIGDFGVLLYAGFEKKRALKYNFLTALTAFIGVIFALSLSMTIEGLTRILLPFAAGNFIYIAGSDLIPELHAEEEIGRTLIQMAAMCFGVLLMIAVGHILE